MQIKVCQECGTVVKERETPTNHVYHTLCTCPTCLGADRGTWNTFPRWGYEDKSKIHYELEVEKEGLFGYV